MLTKKSRGTIKYMSEFHRVAGKNDVAPGQAISVEVVGQRVALFNVEGNYYAIGDACTHQGGPLSDGEVDSTTVTCPWHGAQFDLTTGAANRPPASTSVPAYKVVVEGDDIKIEVP